MASSSISETIPRHANWIMTSSGRALDPFAPDPAQIALDDIAHHLSHVCRFAGAVSVHYSVAQHSVLVAQEMPLYARFALLHDAAEAYIGDVPRPLKRHQTFAAYRDVEAHLQAVIYRKFGIVPEPDGIVELAHVDRRMLRTEQRDLMPAELPGEGRDDAEPYLYHVVPWTPQEACSRFEQAWEEATT